MTRAEQILGIVCDCVDELNKQLRPGVRLAKSAETVIVGEGGVLDSLSIINFLVQVEETVSERIGMEIPLLGDPRIGEEGGPFHTLGHLTAFIDEQSSRQ